MIAILTSRSYSQDNDWRLYDSSQQFTQSDSIDIDIVIDTVVINDTPGEVLVIRNGSLDILLSVLEEEPPPLKGFRIRVYMGNSRKNADIVRSIYLKNEYEWKHYLTFKDPNFVVEIGDFMTRLQAEKVREQLNLNFSNPYIVLTEIQQPVYMVEE